MSNYCLISALVFALVFALCFQPAQPTAAAEQVALKTTTPQAPTNLGVDNVTQSSVTISWTDNAFLEDGFKVERKEDGGTFTEVADVGPNSQNGTTSWVDNSVNPGTTYHYRVCTYDLGVQSSYSNEVTTTTAAPVPSAPADLQATAMSPWDINLTWVDTDYETGYKIERLEAGTWSVVATVGADVDSYLDAGLTPDTTYEYQLQAFNSAGDSSYSNVATASTQTEVGPPTQPTGDQVTLRFYIDSTNYFVNDAEETMDTSPVILNGRTLLPIRYVTEPLGAQLQWNGAEQKVTIPMENTTLELWIGNSQAYVDGNPVQIDAGNPNVTPIIRDGRTLLPMRFVSENLGCDVSWNGAQQEVEVTYPAQLN
jgi:titin